MGCASSSTSVHAGPAETQAQGPAPPVNVQDVHVQEKPARELAIKQSRTETFHPQYVLMGKLGKGAFAEVHLARKVSTGQEVAVKISDLRMQRSNGGKSDEIDTKARRAVQKEAAVLRKTGGLPHCVGFFEDFTEGWLSYVIMERCDITFLQALERYPDLTEQTLAPMFAEMMEALCGVHALGIVHRDVKPDNFLCCGEKNQVKLCDFGLAEELPGPNQDMKGVYGTAPFMAPEMLGSQGYNAKADVWSLGVIAYVLLLGQFPYQPAECSAKAMKAAIVTGNPMPTYRPKASLPAPGNGRPAISTSGTNFIKTLLDRDRSARPDAQEAKRDPWLNVSSNGEQWGATSLRPMLYAAKRCGAFDTRKPPDDAKTAGSVGHFVQVAQVKHHGERATPSSPPKEHRKVDRAPSDGGAGGSECASGLKAPGGDPTLVQSLSTGTGGSLSSSHRSRSNMSKGT